MTLAVGERLKFLSEAGARIGDSLDHIQAARTLTRVLVPDFADFADVLLLERVAGELEEPADRLDETVPAMPVRCVATSHDGSRTWSCAMSDEELFRLAYGTPWAEAMTTRTSVHIPRVDAAEAGRISDRLRDWDLRAALTGRALLVVPLCTRGRVLGAMTLLRGPGRPAFGELDLAVAEELGRRGALSIDNGRLYLREVRIAQKLQRSLLPAAPPEVKGARVRFRYRPAGEAARVGGDWFDALPLTGGRLGLVVGEVMGHGLTSTAIMGQLRTAVRALAAQDPAPDRLLHMLDDIARRLGDCHLASCLYAVYDPVERHCRIANAGHVPPVLVSPSGEGRVLALPEGVPIGVGGVDFETVEVPVADGTRLVLCTDGLLENRHGRDVEQGLAALRREVSGPPRSLDEACESVLASLSPDVPSDDVALLLVGMDGIPKEDIAVWELEAQPSMVPRARGEARAKLSEWGLDELADTVELLVSELVTNALVHGAGAIGMRLVRLGSLLCEVVDDGQELPNLCHAAPSDESGRGLQLVSCLSERWGTRRTGTGKAVWFEHSLP